MALGLKQRLFVAAYLKSGCAAEAAKTAGYSAHTAKQQGHRLMKQPEIVAAIDKSAKKFEQSQERGKEEVLRRLWALADETSSEPVKVKVLELLGKAFGLFIEKHEHSGTVKVITMVNDLREDA